MFARVCLISHLTSAAVLCAVSVRADPIVVTGGTVTLAWDGGFTGSTLTGTGFDVWGDVRGSSIGGILAAGTRSFDGSFGYDSRRPAHL